MHHWLVANEGVVVAGRLLVCLRWLFGFANMFEVFPRLIKDFYRVTGWLLVSL